MKSLRLLVVSILIFSTGAIAQESEASIVAKQLLNKLGTAKLAIQVVEQMFSSFRTAMPNVPAEFWDEAIKEIKPDDLVNLVIPIYVENFSAEEMKQMIAFYDTPVGQKYIERLPVITQQSMAVGQKWGQEIGNRVAKKLQEKNYEK